MKRGRVADAIWIAIAVALALYLILPIILVMLFSFNQSALTSLPLTGLTFDWYRKLFAQEYFLPALQNSLIIAVAVCILSVTTGTLAALALARMPPATASRILYLLALPMMLPALVIGIALLSYFVRFLSLRLGLVSVILGQLVIVQPFVLAIVYARLAELQLGDRRQRPRSWRLADARLLHRHLAGDPADAGRRGTHRAVDLAR